MERETINMVIVIGFLKENRRKNGKYKRGDGGRRKGIISHLIVGGD